MSEYEFTLKFNLLDDSQDPNIYVKHLYENNCDDALIGVGQQGRIALDFIREAENALDAVMSAVKDVKTVIPHAQLIEATPDIVGATDIASVLGVSRQNIRKLTVTHKATFPTPIHEEKSTFWHLASVLSWFKEKQNYPFDESLFDIATVNMQLNIAKEAQKLDHSISSKLAAIF
ncbi:DNA-binding protein [Candidatus Albibeggiatoa sp. nov. BB20]|uniref:helix-turn-helix transcriptional regulator n=1 Tax=Candidatus Albibeggiatoa sp. nov. BB20 TaxID=3162723 RepID=UPI0033654103